MGNMIRVEKWNGSLEKYQPGKVRRTLVRVGASNKVAEKVLERLESEIYDGIPTDVILDKAFEFLKDYQPKVSFMRDLRTALGEMKPKPDFEQYVRVLLESQGYEAQPSRVIQGYCVTHEIDGVLSKDNKTIYLEVKNHRDYHNYTPFSVTLAAKAKADDIHEGFRKGMNNFDFDKILIVCNTRLTGHARQYAECQGIEHIGWNEPTGHGIDSLITETGIYPITMLKEMSPNEHMVLSDKGVMTLQDLLELEESDISDERLRNLQKQAKALLE